MTIRSQSPLVSVIIPTFNRAWSISKAVDSVLEQDYPNIELIVVDDGSTDNTENILLSYSDSIHLIQQENKGVSMARNTGISAASGELIAFLDSDDYWYPEKISAQVDFFNAHPKAFICQTDEIWVKNGVRVHPKKHHKKLNGMIFTPSLGLCLISPSAVMIRKNLFDRVGVFDESLPACEDYELWLRVTSRYPVSLINKTLTVKTGGHIDQLSSASCLDKYRISALLKILNSNILSDKQYQDAADMLQKKCKIYADGCIKRGRHTVAMYYNNIAEHPEQYLKSID